MEKNDVWYSADGTSWTCATAAAPWGARYGHTSVVHDGKIWVLGGWGDRVSYSDVWCSTDGSSWTLVTDNAGWCGQGGHASVAYDGKIWVIGNEVWCSSDGVNWTQTSPANPWWAERYDHTSVIHDGKMWILGGYWSDVWSSPDGQWWTCATAAAPWGLRQGHTSLSFDDKIWLMGGSTGGWPERFHNDVWSSADGRHWTCAVESAPWTSRTAHASVVFDGRMWVLGGYNRDSSPSEVLNDVWFSADGVTWEQAPEAGPRWAGRMGHTAVVHGGKMWVLGAGRDVWWSSDGATWVRATGQAPWWPRSEQAAVSFEGRLWVLGGYGSVSPFAGSEAMGPLEEQGSLPPVDVAAPCLEVWFHDVWYSYNGVNWWPATAHAAWWPRSGHTAVVFGERIWLLGGGYNPPWWCDWPQWFNDIWYSEGPPLLRAASWRLYR